LIGSFRFIAPIEHFNAPQSFVIEKLAINGVVPRKPPLPELS
jgi:hypothetical protein